MINFTSRIKIIAPSYIAKITGGKARIEVSRSAMKGCDSLITISSLSPNSILQKYTHMNRQWQIFEPQSFANFHTKTKEQTQKVLEIFNKVNGKNQKSFTINVETPEKEFSISEY